jgi:Fe-S cluster assembly iron-binding protein IscA
VLLAVEVGAMLSVTQNAATAIRSLLDRQEMPEGCGLRLTGDSGSGLELFAASAPERDDTVVENDGARVFLDPAVVPALEDKVLDAGRGEDGRLHFRLVTP